MGFGRGKGFTPVILTAPTVTAAAAAASIGGYTGGKALTIPTPTVAAVAEVV